MILETIKKTIANQFDVDIDQISESTNFREDLKADSLDLVELVMDLEEKFNLEVDEDGVQSIKTVGDAVKEIKNSIEIQK